MKRLVAGGLVVLLLLLAYPAWLAFRIWQQSRRDELAPADAIVVLGAAQYDGRPSAVFRARLDHALYLYHEGFAATIIVTGGKQPGDRFTEAEAGRDYLSTQGVPEDAIVMESKGRTTLESLRAVADLAPDAGIKSILLVSDPLHSARVKRMATDLGFERALASPASYVELNRSRLTKARELVREVASLLAYELLNR
jgi:uncharacterized SAM-binding protein YcdF (DUF218 family)